MREREAVREKERYRLSESKKEKCKESRKWTLQDKETEERGERERKNEIKTRSIDSFAEERDKNLIALNIYYVIKCMCIETRSKQLS